MTAPELIRDPSDWQRRCLAARDAGARIALVPTMGYLHDGHLSLMAEARRRVDRLAGGGRALALASIFVNPTQFGPAEDLARYPRDLEGDLEKCRGAGIDWVLSPDSPDRMFPERFETRVEVTRASRGLCGERRPGHFRGVATVVAKLFNLTRPHLAFFGEKDYQQLQVVRAMARDLAFGVEVVGMPIVREPDGLAMSSRNAYLSAEERVRARSISQALFASRERAAGGERDAGALAREAARAIEAAGARLDYVEVVHPETLEPLERAVSGSRMLAAAFVGKTRLIDNVVLP